MIARLQKNTHKDVSLVWKRESWRFHPHLSFFPWLPKQVRAATRNKIRFSELVSCCNQFASVVCLSVCLSVHLFTLWLSYMWSKVSQLKLDTGQWNLVPVQQSHYTCSWCTLSNFAIRSNIAAMTQFAKMHKNSTFRIGRCMHMIKSISELLSKMSRPFTQCKDKGQVGIFCRFVIFSGNRLNLF